MKRSFALRQVNGKHQVTLPNEICQKLGIHGGDYVKIKVEGKSSVITPVEVREREFTPQEVRVMNSDVRKQIKSGDYTEYKDVSEAKKHLKSLK